MQRLERPQVNVPRPVNPSSSASSRHHAGLPLRLDRVPHEQHCAIRMLRAWLTSFRVRRTESAPVVVPLTSTVSSSDPSRTPYDGLREPRSGDPRHADDGILRRVIVKDDVSQSSLLEECVAPVLFARLVNSGSAQVRAQIVSVSEFNPVAFRRVGSPPGWFVHCCVAFVRRAILLGTSTSSETSLSSRHSYPPLGCSLFHHGLFFKLLVLRQIAASTDVFLVSPLPALLDCRSCVEQGDLALAHLDLERTFKMVFHPRVPCAVPSLQPQVVD